jgi:hypothetical protein
LTSRTKSQSCSEEVAVPGDARIVDEHVEPAELRDERLHATLGRLGGADVTDDCDRPAAGIGEAPNRRIQRLLVRVEQPHGCALGSERAGDPGAEAHRSPRDEDDAPVE